MPDFELEARARDRGFHLIVGVDEAGRGSWAGPVLASAVMLNSVDLPRRLLEGLDDSKKLSAQKRDVFIRPVTGMGGYRRGAGGGIGN